MKTFSGSLDAWLKRLENLHSREIDLGLERVGEVARRLGLPLTAESRRPQVLTFAGTNGKGSTLTLSLAIAQAAGLRVGSYTSPHFLRFNERIQLDGQPVEDAELVAAFEAIEAARLQVDRPPISLSYFEFATLAALLIFAEADLDLWLLEVGLGGRLDAVNLVDADVAVVTTVGLDHQEYLGSDLQVIGQEKAGIFRPGGKAVLGSSPANLPASVRQRAEELSCHIAQLGREFFREDQEQSWTWQGLDAQGKPLKLDALPWPQLPWDNAATSIQALMLAACPLTTAAISQGLQTAQLTGRWQRQGGWLLDVAHNPQAAAYMAAKLKETPKRRLAVVGMMADKDQQGTLEPLLERVDAWWVTGLPTPRAAAPGDLAGVLQKLGARVEQMADWDEAARLYREGEAALAAGEVDEILVLGSFFTLALFLELMPVSKEASCVTV